MIHIWLSEPPGLDDKLPVSTVPFCDYESFDTIRDPGDTTGVISSAEKCDNCRVTCENTAKPGEIVTGHSFIVLR